MASRITLEPFISEAIQKKLDLFSVSVFSEEHGTADFYWEKWGAHWRHNTFSASKSVLSLAIGLALEEGLLSMEDRPAEMFQELKTEEYDPRFEEVTLRHLLTMSTGQDRKLSLMGSMNRDRIPSWLNYCVNLPMEHAPGTLFRYNNAAPFLASAMLSKKAGMPVVDYLKPRLFDPLDIPNPQWLMSPEGINAGSGGLLLSAEEMMRIGRLFLDEGRYEGHQLVPAHWIRKASSLQVETPVSPGATPERLEYQSGYGYYIWMSSEGRGYRADGNGNQLIFVLPKKRTVVVVTGMDNSNGVVHQLVWSTIYPQL